MSTHNLDDFIICDLWSGTFFGAAGAVILDTRWLSKKKLKTLEEGSDSERIKLCEKHGSCLENLIDGTTIKRPANEKQ